MFFGYLTELMFDLVVLLEKLSCVNVLSRFDLSFQLVNLLDVFLLLLCKVKISLVLLFLLIFFVQLLLSLLGQVFLSVFLGFYSVLNLK